MSDELLDVVSDEDLVTAQEMRSTVHQHGLQHRGIHIFLVTPDSRLLVQQRSRNRDNAPLALDCSVSEHVKAGEDYLSAAQRGLAEELGLDQIDIHPILKFKMAYGPSDNEICQLYEGVVDPAAVHFDPVEVERIDFYNLSDLENLVETGKITLCYWFVELIQWYVGKPSKVQTLKTFTPDRLLLRGTR